MTPSQIEKLLVLLRLNQNIVSVTIKQKSGGIGPVTYAQLHNKNGNGTSDVDITDISDW